MSYPFYYPYFSARNVHPAPLLDLSSVIQRYSRLEEEQAEIQLAVRLKQQQIAAERVRQYQEELRQKQRYYESRYSGTNQAYILNNSLKRNEVSYADEHEDPRNIDRYENSQQLKASISNNPILFKEEHIKNSKDSYYERRVQQYQQQLLEKIQRKNKSQFAQKENKKKEGTRKKQQKINRQQSNRVNEPKISKGEENIIINKRPKQQIQSNFRNPLGQIKRNSQSIQQNYCRYQTIDVNDLRPKIKKIFNHSNAKKNTLSVYQSQKKKSQKSKRRSNSFIHIKQKSENVVAYPKRDKEQKPKNGSLSSMALNKIENRLKLSSIVYKDSKWSNERYHIDHLVNTYEMQEKGRKDIRDRINNNQDILKKYPLVVSSR